MFLTDDLNSGESCPLQRYCLEPSELKGLRSSEIISQNLHSEAPRYLRYPASLLYHSLPAHASTRRNRPTVSIGRQRYQTWELGTRGKHRVTHTRREVGRRPRSNPWRLSMRLRGRGTRCRSRSGPIGGERTGRLTRPRRDKKRRCCLSEDGIDLSWQMHVQEGIGLQDQATILKATSRNFPCSFLITTFCILSPISQFGLLPSTHFSPFGCLHPLMPHRCCSITMYQTVHWFSLLCRTCTYESEFLCGSAKVELSKFACLRLAARL